MKIRQGFVSNSSSSSFVVLKQELSANVKDGTKILITAAQEKALKKFGFRPLYIRSPYQVPETEEGWEKAEKNFQKTIKSKPSQKTYRQGKRFGMSKQKVDRLEKLFRNNYAWGYSLVCNQDDVIKFLIENKISFRANVHYDHETYFYMPESDSLVIAQNYGNRFLTYSSLLENGETVPNEDMGKAVRFLKASEYAKNL